MTLLASRTLRVAPSCTAPSLEETLQEMDDLRHSARSLFSACVRVENGALVIPGSLFTRSHISLKDTLTVHHVAGALLLKAQGALHAQSWGHRTVGDVHIPLPRDTLALGLAELLADHALFIGKGALLLAPASRVPQDLGRYRTLTAFTGERMASYNPSRVLEVAQRFEPGSRELLAWKDEALMHKYLRVDGGPADVAGLQVGEPLVYTRYTNGLLVQRGAPEHAAHEVKRGRRQVEGHPQEFRARVWAPTELFDGHSAARVLAFDGALFIMERSCTDAQACPATYSLEGVRKHPRVHPLAQPVALGPAPARGRTMRYAWFRIGGLQFEGVDRAERAVRPRGDGASLNSACYAHPGQGNRLQLQGDWLKDWGFVPGARYDVAPNPIVKSSVLVSLNPQGAYRVTALTKGGQTPKLYVPARLLEALPHPQVRVVGTAMGLVLRKG